MVFTEDVAEGIGDFAYRRIGFDGGEEGGEEIFGGGGAAGKFAKGGFCAGRVAFRAQGLQARHLSVLDLRVDEEGRDCALLFGNEFVYADYDLFFSFDGSLIVVGGLLDFSLDKTAFDRSKHASHGVDFFQISEGACFDFVGQAFDGIGACDRVDGIGDTGFVGDDLLRAQGDQGGVFGGERERFVERVGVERVGAAKRGQYCFQVAAR